MLILVLLSRDHMINREKTAMGLMGIEKRGNGGERRGGIADKFLSFLSRRDAQECEATKSISPSYESLLHRRA